MQHPESSLVKVIFLDKDGTLVKDVPYNVDPEKVVFETGVFEGLRALQDYGFKLVIISNQSGLALERFTQVQLDDLIDYFYLIFEQNGIELSGFYYCPHAPSSENVSCACRKPQPGLLIQAAHELHIDLARSWMIGDILHDVEAGNRAGCRTILIDNGNETEWLKGPFREPTYTTPHFPDATNHITKNAVPNA
ncbi:HAD-IIIA family hydrolase [Dyadobacter sp. CY347]|uniref:D-glycero-alpha-D-manno-heptose-1,7-bisphosphate 7-phosphatase n=1 Tax=Dyadobacter sp. CY347 TaxID=2909336 RepID=UPI001F174C0E|nr:HAD family hydrolase [Dyadobacter sp. CY347]MCF2488133.1 HAD family hydrolase [Dyadobacter sp. CY347]